MFNGLEADYEDEDEDGISVVNRNLPLKIYTIPARLNQDSLHTSSSQAYRDSTFGCRPSRLSAALCALCDCQAFTHNGIEWRNSPF